MVRSRGGNHEKSSKKVVDTAYLTAEWSRIRWVGVYSCCFDALNPGVLLLRLAHKFTQLLERQDWADTKEGSQNHLILILAIENPWKQQVVPVWTIIGNAYAAKYLKSFKVGTVSWPLPFPRPELVRMTGSCATTISFLALCVILSALNVVFSLRLQVI